MIDGSRRLRTRAVGVARRASWFCCSCGRRRRLDELLQVLDGDDVCLLFCWCGCLVSIECSTLARLRGVQHGGGRVS